MTNHRVATLIVATAAAAGAVVALAAVATAASREPRCQVFPDALDRTAAHQMCGPLLDRYLAEGGPEGLMGRPLTDEQPNPPGRWRVYGDRVAVFERGAIYLDTGPALS